MDRKTAFYFRQCPAKRGHGAERQDLLKELMAEELLHTHLIIMTMAATGKSYTGPQEWLDKRTACEARLLELEEALSKVVGAPKAPKD